MKQIFLLLFFLPLFCKSQSITPERVEKYKSSVVRIIINGNAVGTGFFISKEGMLLSCWHVIQPAITLDSISRKLKVSTQIYIELRNGQVLPVSLLKSQLSTDFLKSSFYDYAVLKVEKLPASGITYLKIGKFSDADEGSMIYSIGYPFGIAQQILASGIISTKFEQDFRYLRSIEKDTVTLNRKQAWIDITMNRGNSGGPIILPGKTIDEDRVIGIATFILNPNNEAAEAYQNYISKSISEFGSINFNGLDYAEINKFFTKTILDNSIGISGCVAIDHSTTK